MDARKEAAMYVKAAIRKLRRPAYGYAHALAELKPDETTPEAISRILSMPVQKSAFSDERFTQGKALAGHAARLLQGARFMYIKSTAGGPDAPVSNCLLFESQDRRLRTGRTAWRVEIPDDAVLFAPACGRPAIAGSKTIAQTGAVCVRRARQGLGTIWIPCEESEAET